MKKEASTEAKSQIRNPKSELPALAGDESAWRPQWDSPVPAADDFRISEFGFPSDFGFRISDLKPRPERSQESRTRS
jgi:hypothetical protein